MSVKPLPSREHLRALFDYDPLTGALKWKADYAGWSPQMRGRWAGKAAGSTDPQSGYISVSIDGTEYLAHRIVWKILHGVEPAFLDHKDNDGSNNRESNLRPCTRSQNGGNRRPNRGRELPKGVYLMKSGKYRAVIQADNTPRNLGLFQSLDEASAAYEAAARRLFGQFARVR